MLVYSVLLFVFSALLITVGAFICSGRYELIYDYYISGVTDLKQYTRAHGIATMCLSIPLIACGVLQLAGPEIPFAFIGMGILVIGIVVAYICFYQIQKKYNGGMF